MNQAPGLLQTHHPEVWAKLTRLRSQVPSTERFHDSESVARAEEVFTRYINGGHKFNDCHGGALRDAATYYLQSYTGAFSYLLDLKAKVGKGYTLTPKQMAGVLNCMAADVKRTLAGATPAVQFPVDKLPSCKVLVRATLPDGTLKDVKIVIDRPNQRSRWHGWVFVSFGAWKNGLQVYAVKPDGTHVPKWGRNVASTAWINDEAQAALKALCADPLGVIAASGHLTNRCGICNRELSDPESVRLGIGPICLKKTQHGLALGNFGPQVSPAAPVVPVVPTPAPVAPAPAPPTYSEEAIREALEEALTEDGLMAPEKPAAPLRTLAEVLAERDAREAETPVEAVSEAVPVERPRQARSVATRPRKNRAARE